MSRILVAAALALLVPALASAQTTVHVAVDVHVDTPPPTEIVIVEPSPADVVVVEAVPEPQPEPQVSPAPPGRGIVPVLHGRGAFLLTGDEMAPGLGGGAGVGLRFDPEWTGSLVVTYLSDLGRRSELDVGIEVSRDFAPSSDLGFVVLAGLGAAFGLDDPNGARIRGMAQLGIGARTTIFDPRVALLVDLRGVLRYRVPDANDGPLAGPEVSGGILITTGLSIALD